MSSYYISLTFNFLLIIAFVADRIFRIRSIREYREARDAQVSLLKEKVEFIEKYNDDFVSEKYKKSIDNLKILVNDKELEIENNKQELELIKQLQEKNDQERLSYQNTNEGLVAQKTKLEESNARLQKEKEEINIRIESSVKELTDKNKKLFEYSTYLSHQIRGPVATLRGLINLNREGLINTKECVSMMDKCVFEIDQKIIESIGDDINDV